MIGAIFVKFSQLILMKIIKIVATRCQILMLKCTKFNLGWGCTPDTAGEAYSVPPDPLAGLKGPSSKGKGEEREWKVPSTCYSLFSVDLHPCLIWLSGSHGQILLLCASSALSWAWPGWQNTAE